MQSRFITVLAILLLSSICLNVWLFNANLNPLTTVKENINQRINYTSSTSTRSKVTPPNASVLTPINKPPSTAEQDPRTALNQLFEQQQYQLAVLGLTSMSQDIQAQLKALWFAKLEVFLTEQNLASVFNFSQYYLNHYPFDVPMLTMTAKAHILNGELSIGIEQYYQIIRRVTPTEEKQLLPQIHQLANNELSALEKAASWQDLLDFVTPLLEYEPDYGPYLLSQSLALFQLQQFYEALDPLILIIDHPKYGPPAKILKQKILTAMQQTEAIKLRTLGEHFVITGSIDDRYSVDLLIDTGASLSVVSKRYFDSLTLGDEAEFIGKRVMATAGGNVTASVYRFNSFSIDNYQVKNIEFVVMELEGMPGSDGLLGMNFLKQFKFQIDQQEKLLLLKGR